MENDLNQLSVTDLVSMFEESEDATYDARALAERDRDYYDNKQLTAAEKATLAKRGQPEIVVNRIKRKIDYLVGIEKSQRVDPQALPNTPMHDDDADGATRALRHVALAENFDAKRSAVWRNMLIEGSGGISVRVEPGHDGQPRIVLGRVAWDRMFWDPHSSELDYSDATYLGTVTWMDYDDALATYPDSQEILDSTLSTINPQDTFDDKPKSKIWADTKRKRVRVVQIWIKRDEQWHFAEFTRGGILKSGPSPYVDDKGRSDCELIFQSAYVDRDNDRYGTVREMISPQDEINKRRSKALHLLNTSQIVMRQGAVDDIEAARREAARGDGVLVINGNPSDPLSNSFQFNTRADLASAQLGLLQEAKNEIDLMGPNGAMLGDQVNGSAPASGRALLASQQGGMMQMGDLLDNLRQLDVRVFKAIWYRIRQFWTAEKWIRVTDDERNIKWIGMNVDRRQLAQLSPEVQEMIAGTVGSVAELDCDITIDEAPDSVAPALEQFQALVQLKKFDVNNELPFRAILRAAPNLRNKSRIFQEMDQAVQAREQEKQARAQLEIQGAQATVADVAASAGLKQAQTMRTMREAQGPGQGSGQVPGNVPGNFPPNVAAAQAAATLRHTPAMRQALAARLAAAQAAAQQGAQPQGLQQRAAQQVAQQVALQRAAQLAAQQQAAQQAQR